MPRTNGVAAARVRSLRRAIERIAAAGRQVLHSARPLARSAFGAVREVASTIHDDLRPFIRTVKHPGRR
jgi:hypothetical protein